MTEHLLPGALPTPIADHPMRFVDTETSGGRAGPETLLEIAIVDEWGTVLMDTLIDPGRPIDPRVTAIHGITDELVQHAPSWSEIEPLVTGFLTGAEFVAHGAAFDRAVVGRAAEGAAAFSCTIELCRRKLGRPRRLSAAAELAGFSPPGPWHRALPDALACRSVYRWLSSLPDLSDNDRRALKRAAAQAARERREQAQMWDRRLVRVPAQLCPPPVMAGWAWTLEMDERLTALWHSGRDMLDLLEEFPRTPAAIFARLERLGLIPAAFNPYARDPT
jgi:DNA polymerase III epsilon subunit-like protein